MIKDFDAAYIDASLARDFPAVPQEAIAMPKQTQDISQMPLGTGPDDIQLAEVGSRNLPESAYTGRNPDSITALDPTMRQRLSGFLQAGLEGIGIDRYKARQHAETLIGGPSSNLPISFGLADIVPILGTTLQTQESARMMGDAKDSFDQGNYGTAALQAGGGALGILPGISGTAKVLNKGAKALFERELAGTATPGNSGAATGTASSKAKAKTRITGSGKAPLPGAE